MASKPVETPFIEIGQMRCFYIFYNSTTFFTKHPSLTCFSPLTAENNKKMQWCEDKLFVFFGFPGEEHLCVGFDFLPSQGFFLQ